MRKAIKNAASLAICFIFVIACMIGLASLGEPVTAAIWDGAIQLWAKN